MASVMRPQMIIEAGMRAAAALRSIAPPAGQSPENNLHSYNRSIALNADWVCPTVGEAAR
jgi:hypothetical protein